MMNNYRDTYLQIFISLLFLGVLIFLNYYLNKYGLPQSTTGMLFLSTSFIFVTISYFYVTIGLFLRENSTLFEHKLWNRLSAFIFIVLLISFFGFIFSYNLFLNKFDIWNIIMLLIIVYFLLLYFLLILSVVYKLCEQKNRIIHYSYI